VMIVWGEGLFVFSKMGRYFRGWVGPGTQTVFIRKRGLCDAQCRTVIGGLDTLTGRHL
jgi:hypothetical protein